MPPRFDAAGSNRNLADQVGRLSRRLRGVLGHDSPQLEGQGLLPRLLLAKKKLCMSAETYLFLSRQVLTGQDENGKIGGSWVGPPFRQQLQAAHLRQQQVQNHQFGQGSGHLSTGLGTIGSGGHGVALLGEQFGDDFAGGRVVFHDKIGRLARALPLPARWRSSAASSAGRSTGLTRYSSAPSAAPMLG